MYFIMGKSSTVYICQTCGTELPKWSGQCPNCGAWNSLVETMAAPKKDSRFKIHDSRSQGIKPLKLSEVEVTKGPGNRVQTGIGELDRVLGGGLVAGSVVLVAGEPGIGKSTLLTQLALKVAQSSMLKAKSIQRSALGSTSVLYVCGEESPEQVKLRTDRLAASSMLKAKSLRQE